MEPQTEEDRLLQVAEAIGQGTPVDWQQVEQRAATPSTTGILQQLRVLDRLATMHAPRTAMAEWGSLSKLEPIGHGAFGTVYRAFDPDLQREVALKVTRPRDATFPIDPDRLVREARLLARVRHPNVVTVFGAQRQGDEVGVCMELITGETLAYLVESFGPYSAGEAAVIGLDVCRALAAVHSAGLLHGDVKAHNVMREEGGRIVLMDFGAGRDLHPAPGRAHDMVGTPVYVAPEVFAGAPCSRASDIYSVGVLLFYLATGTYPVEGDTRSQIRQQHRWLRGRRRLRDVRPDLPDAFIQVVERATAPRPEQRYQSAGDLAADLNATLAAREAPPAGRDRRLLAGPAVVAAAIALAGIAYWSSGDTAAPSMDDRAAAIQGTATYEVEAAVYRVGANGPVKLQPNSRLALGDKLFLEIHTSVPAYVYIANLDDRGGGYLLFPLPGQPDRRLPPGPHRLPGLVRGEEHYWEVTSAGEREHLLVYVTPDPLPEFAQLLRMLPPPTDPAALAVRLPSDAFGVLRGIGGIAPAGSGVPHGIPGGGAALPALPAGTDSATGLWMRQITFENPGA